VPFGGIGEVATLPEVRGRGYSSELLRRSIGLMAGLRQPLSVLGTPIPEFYARLGWEIVARPDFSLSLDAAAPAGDEGDGLADGGRAGAGDFAVRPFRREDLDACVGLYERFCARRPRSLVRTRAYWDGQLEKIGLVPSGFNLPPSRALVALSRRDGRVAAYVRFRELAPWRGQGLGVDEACYREPEAMAALWPHLVRAAREAAPEGRGGALAVRVPEDHALVGLMLGAGGRREIERGQMVRLNDLGRLLGHMRRPMERRLRRAGVPPMRLRVAARYRWLPEDPGGGDARLDWDGRFLRVEAGDGDGAAVCPFDSTGWLRLLLGESRLEVLLEEYRCPEEVGRFFGAALPRDWGAPIYWRSDAF
jgi:hypothetical protein